MIDASESLGLKVRIRDFVNHSLIMEGLELPAGVVTESVDLTLRCHDHTMNFAAFDLDDLHRF